LAKANRKGAVVVFSVPYSKTNKNRSVAQEEELA
jgi:hypothetical protein